MYINRFRGKMQEGVGIFQVKLIKGCCIRDQLLLIKKIKL